MVSQAVSDREQALYALKTSQFLDRVLCGIEKQAGAGWSTSPDVTMRLISEIQAWRRLAALDKESAPALRAGRETPAVDCYCRHSPRWHSGAKRRGRCLFPECRCVRYGRNFFLDPATAQAAADIEEDGEAAAARVRRAAPELRSACDQAMRAFGPPSIWLNGSPRRRALNVLTEALAKADGTRARARQR